MLGLHLRRLRTAAGHSLRSMARKLDISHATIQNWETDKARIYADQLVDFLMAAGVPPDAWSASFLLLKKTHSASVQAPTREAARAVRGRGVAA